MAGYSSSRMGRARTLSPTPAGRASRAGSRKAAAVCRPAADRSPRARAAPMAGIRLMVSG